MLQVPVGHWQEQPLCSPHGSGDTQGPVVPGGFFMSPVHGTACPSMGTTAWAVTSLMSLDIGCFCSHQTQRPAGLGCSEQGLSPLSLLEGAQGAVSHPPSARQVPSAPLSRWHRHSGHQAASAAATTPSHCPQGAFAASGVSQPQQPPELGRPLRGAWSSVWGAGLVLLWVQQG